MTVPASSQSSRSRRWVQLQVGSNGYTSQQGPAPARFFDNITVGAKLHLVDQDKLTPAISLSAAAGLPVGSEPASDDALFTLYVTKDLGPLHADFNTGLQLPPGQRRRLRRKASR